METVKGDQASMTKNLKVKGSPENEAFYTYLNYINNKQAEAAPYRKVVQDSTISEKKKKDAKAKLKEIDVTVKDYKANFMEKNKDKFVTKVLATSEEPEIPEVPKNEKGEENIYFARNYYMSHFWDGTDFSDERLLRTPVLHNKIEKYMTKLTVQHPDSIAASADILVDKAKANKEVFKYIVHYITNNYEKSNVMGMDGVFVHMAQKYYMTGQAHWVDSTQLAKISERANKLAPILVGKVTPNVILQDTTEKNWHNLHQLQADYTVLYFWDPGCGHCKKETPKLKKLYDELQGRGESIEVFAVCTELETKDWKKYIRENDLNWINVSDNPEINQNAVNYLQYTTIKSLNFRDTYDIYSTPRVFLLDKDKKIIAKRLGIDQLGDLLDKLLKQDKKKK